MELNDVIVIAKLRFKFCEKKNRCIKKKNDLRV